MEIGMLWFDNSGNPLSEKVERAVTYYVSKYGESPTVCVVHTDSLNGHKSPMEGLELRESQRVMPDHFWVGVEEEKQGER
jgi:hypothetical protein